MKNTEVEQLIYLDHAATSRPKPPSVLREMMTYMTRIGANAGRSAHRLSIAASRAVFAAREKVAALFNAPDPLRVVFTANVTEGMNLAFRGLLKPGDHVVTSSMEHNAVMRPLRLLEKEGVKVTVVPCDAAGRLDLDRLSDALTPATRLIALNHASNVVGTLLPVAAAGRIAREHGALLLVDTAQTAGALPIDMQVAQVDIIGFTGHKSLLGPPGTGGLIFGERIQEDELKPFLAGGTGSHSETEDQPRFLPDMFESGTANTMGLVGLAAGLDFLMGLGGPVAIRKKELALTRRLLAGLQNIEQVTLFGTGEAESQTSTVSFTIQGMNPSDAGLRLDEDFNIMSRVGLHCSPAAHRTIGTFPEGTLRFGLGYSNTEQEVVAALEAVAELAREASKP